MSENSENLIVEHLRIIRSDVGNIRQDMAEVRMRLTSIEERLTLVEKGIANVHGDLAIVQTGLDRQGERIERIEKKRLDLTATRRPHQHTEFRYPTIGMPDTIQPRPAGLDGAGWSTAGSVNTTTSNMPPSAASPSTAPCPSPKTPRATRAHHAQATV